MTETREVYEAQKAWYEFLPTLEKDEILSICLQVHKGELTPLAAAEKLREINRKDALAMVGRWIGDVPDMPAPTPHSNGVTDAALQLLIVWRQITLAVQEAPSHVANDALDGIERKMVKFIDRVISGQNHAALMVAEGEMGAGW